MYKLVPKKVYVTYLNWLKANHLRDSDARRYAFISGWTICDGNYQAVIKTLKASH